ncbi:hypothetical protein CAPTEDRAFT_169570 [Capitella teleta]|uniref:Ras-specific guanine nucleotide-releasing factor 2 n=1 Tax=Capitella teleta TaxID=283909 RepID=R7TQP0_CAPTE|nr:hypothetical protein CAPTEDRAFT_169570 [Capitella teleta]|eukprot:ELT93796.1 hypothetical protein CAPTEDRAFT_169570 [Capitella teleta]
MQKGIRLNESQLLYLAGKARQDSLLRGYLHKKSADTGKWQQRFFVLYQNLLFYFESDGCVRPSGVALLEGCYCERLVTATPTSAAKSTKDEKQQYCFAVYYRKEGHRQYDLRAETEAECNQWINTIKQASFSKVLEQKEQLEQKHLHLLQILEAERQAKWHYVQQTEELAAEVKKLKNENSHCGRFFQLWNKRERSNSNDQIDAEESEELKKIKKVQSFFRGWLCRRRWKQIVEEYIRSDHAESMRKRNSIIFGMVECEEEYVKQLSALVSVFLRPLRMAASSKKPPITHEDVNSIFLNSETLLFLHQIFLKGLSARMENWPTLVLGDLFDMLLPMLGIYQEYVRNHHYSLQVLAEYKQKPEFNSLVRRYEEKSVCEGRSLETFLTYPMHQIPRYIITIHELLAHTPHDHVERKSLEYAQSKLEELSQIMQDEVSETENIRKNLAIERMIVEGCDILLDVNQTFVRQGTLVQVINDKPKSGRGRLGSFSSSFKESKKDSIRQVFLFTNHVLLTTRTSNGRLHLVKHYGKLPLIDCTLVEDSSSDIFHFEDNSEKKDTNYNGLDFRLIIDTKSGPPITIILLASTLQEKAAWCSDISQCIENLHYTDLLHSSMSDTSSVTMPQSVRSDPKLFRDDIDIKFSRTLNSCRVPQIRHASTDRLLDRLTDLRFLSIDFLNTFLLTYRVFTTGQTVLEALKRVYRNPDLLIPPKPKLAPIASCETLSEASEVLPIYSESSDSEEEGDSPDSYTTSAITITTKSASSSSSVNLGHFPGESYSDHVILPPDLVNLRTTSRQLSVPIALSPQGGSSETLTSTHSFGLSIAGSSDTLVPISPRSSPLGSPQNSPRKSTIAALKLGFRGKKIQAPPIKISSSNQLDALALSPATSPKFRRVPSPVRRATSPCTLPLGRAPSPGPRGSSSSLTHPTKSPLSSPKLKRASSPICYSFSSPNIISNLTKARTGQLDSYLGKRGSAESEAAASTSNFSPRGSFAASEGSPPAAKAGTVVTSSRASKRRSSSTAATAAFAAATAGSTNPKDHPKGIRAGELKPYNVNKKRESVISTAATMRVLNVLRHWVSKHSQDFESNPELKVGVKALLEEMSCNSSLLPAEHRAASSILHVLTKEEETVKNKVDLQALLLPPTLPSRDTFDTLSALDVAEQLTYLDHQIFMAIRSEELLGQAWMKPDKSQKATQVLLVSKRFNEVSRLVVSEIVTRQNCSDRVACIEKWAAIADICRCLHNYNGVLQICAAFVNSSVYRLKKTWEKISKQTKQMIEKLQTLVSSDCRFKNMRDALHRCDPPCIPYLGMYLSDLSFIEEGTPNITDETLVNFSKMRMIAHVIREVQHYQQTPYKIDHQNKVTTYLLDTSRLLDEEETYKASLEIEPRQARVSMPNMPLT